MNNDIENTNNTIMGYVLVEDVSLTGVSTASAFIETIGKNKTENLLCYCVVKSLCPVCACGRTRVCACVRMCACVCLYVRVIDERVHVCMHANVLK